MENNSIVEWIPCLFSYDWNIQCNLYSLNMLLTTIIRWSPMDIAHQSPQNHYISSHENTVYRSKSIPYVSIVFRKGATFIEHISFVFFARSLKTCRENQADNSGERKATGGTKREKKILPNELFHSDHVVK